jgi:class 3 adenylate cyclase/tetratricopeptide (TPR) repeat protein
MRFCGGCGTPLAEVAIEEERKDVAVLFADIADFTALVASRDPEETKDKIEACLRTMAEQVVAVDGVVEKFIGDAIMAVFGVPAAHDNDAERAVRAGWRILEQVRWFGASAGLDVELRIGIHFGEVIVSAHDRAPGREHHVFGEVVNLASRLEKTGEVGAVVVSEEVYRRTKEVFAYEELPKVKVKGVEKPLVRYRLVGERTERGKIRGIRGLSAPMIAREEELRILREAYREAAAGPRARVAAVVGEAGLGKTRLTEELIQTLHREGEAPRILHGRCLAYTGAPTYLPFIQILKSALGVKDDMALVEEAAQVREGVRRIWPEERWGDVNAVELLTELLAPGGDGRRPAGRDTDQIRAQLFFVVEGVLSSLAASEPVVVVVEDAQWADRSSLALIEHLARTLQRARVFMVLNLRPPEDSAPHTADLLGTLAGYDHVTVVELEDLSPEESGELVAALLEVEKLPTPTRRFIIDRAAGNPFFVEEIIKSLIEEGVLVQRGDSWAATREIEALDIPDTIEGVLRSRLDNLPRLQKRLIQRASVVGEVFWRKIVAELMERGVDDYLDDLERRDLVRQRLESIFEDDLEYIFKHTILHETVYNSILRRVRRTLHLRTAHWIEQNYADRIEAYFPLVAHHYECGGEPARAAEYFVRAATRAAALYANENAKKFYGQAAAHTTDPSMARRIYFGWGEVCARTGHNYEAISNFEGALNSCRTAEEEAEVYHRLGDVYEKMSAYPKALDYFALAEELLAGQPPTLVLAHVYKSSAWVHYLQGDFEVAFEVAQKADDILERLHRDDFDADMVRARLHNIRGAIYHEWNLPEEARLAYDWTLALYEKHGNLFGVATILNNIGTTEMTQGRLASALAFLHKSFGLGSRSGNRFSQAVNCCNLGEAYLTVGDYDEARRYLDLYVETNAAIGNRLGDGYAFCGRARVAAEVGAVQEAEADFRKAIAVFEEVGAAENARETRFSLAEFFAARGRAEEAGALVATERDRRDDTRLQLWEAIITSRLPAEILAAAEKDDLRRIVIRGAAALAAQKDVMERLEIASALARLSAALADEDNARIFREEVEKLARGVETGISDEKHRVGFRRRLAERVLGR